MVNGLLSSQVDVAVARCQPEEGRRRAPNCPALPEQGSSFLWGGWWGIYAQGRTSTASAWGHPSTWQLSLSTWQVGISPEWKHTHQCHTVSSCVSKHKNNVPKFTCVKYEHLYFLGKRWQNIFLMTISCLAEILELAGNAARDNKKGRITPRHIKLAVANDEELNQVQYNSH